MGVPNEANDGLLGRMTPDICAIGPGPDGGVQQNAEDILVKNEYAPEMQYLCEDYAKMPVLGQRPAPGPWHQYHTIHVRTLHMPLLATTTPGPMVSCGEYSFVLN